MKTLLSHFVAAVPMTNFNVAMDDVLIKFMFVMVTSTVQMD